MTDIRAALAPSKRAVYWLDSPDRPLPRHPVAGDVRCDLLIVGGGFSGLWAAVRAKEREPDLDVVLVEADRLGSAASGRNGGFCSASLTHGSANGSTRYPAEADRLEAMGRENLDAIEETVQRYGIDCDFRRSGTINVATQEHEVAWLRAGHGEFLDRAAVRAEVDSPTFLAGNWEREGSALVDPAALTWGLADAAERLGVRIFERTPASALRREDGRMAVTTPRGGVSAKQVVLGTNAFPGLLRRTRLATVPVYDYVLMTEPLTKRQRAAIGWGSGAGLSGVANQFHYYRMTRDGRILWGGYDAIYHYGRSIDAKHENRDVTYEKLARQFFETFPQLEGLRFSHRWAGVIDTCSRFFAFFGTAFGGDVAYVTGYTGLGVGATRFAADVMLDLLGGTPTERTRLTMVRRKPIPFPPEPFAYLAVQITKRSLAKADASGGRRDLWLRILDRFGLGFDS
jgi:glycine/D-amino acid oxidase-like deaminating enzyme